MKMDYAEPSSDTESKSPAYEDLGLVFGFEGACSESRFTRPLTKQEQIEKSNVEYVNLSETMKEVYARPYCIASSALRGHLSIASIEEGWDELPALRCTKIFHEISHLASLAYLFRSLISHFEKQQLAGDDDISEYVRSSFCRFEEVEAIFYGKHLDENQYTILVDSLKYSENLYNKLIEVELNILDRFEGRPILITFIWGNEKEVTFNLPKGSVTLARRISHD
jgi:hypothetical protein